MTGRQAYAVQFPPSFVRVTSRSHSSTQGRKSSLRRPADSDQRPHAGSIRIVIADDQPIVLEGLEQLLKRTGGFEVLDRVTDGESALRAVRTCRPDLVLLGAGLPGADSHTILRAIVNERLSTRIVLRTTPVSEATILNSLRLGASGVIQKDAPTDDLVKCLRRVHAGEKFVPRRMLARAYDDLLRREEAIRDALGGLTKREIDIVRLAVLGLANKEIASRLLISVGTVKIHLHHIYEKLGVENRVALILFAQEKDILG